MIENTTPTPSYRVGDRVRTIVDTPSTPSGNLGGIVAVYPCRPGRTESISVLLDNDPHRLPISYAPHEIAPAPTLRELIDDVVYHHVSAATGNPDPTSQRIVAGILEVVNAEQERLLRVVAEWVGEAENGASDHGDLCDDLRTAGYQLPGTDDEETE